MNHPQRFAQYGQTTGQGSYSAPNGYQQSGPKVAGHGDRYDQYGNGNGHQYGG